MLSTLASYRVMSTDMTSALQRVSEQPLPAREIKYFSETIQSIKSVDEFIENDRVFSFAMQAFGLSEMTYAKAFMAKVLNEGVTADDSFANTLSDTRYQEFADTFNFEAFGTAATSFTKANEGTVEKYIRQTLEEQAGDSNEGVRLALYFQRKASDIGSYLEILADPAIAEVVRTALSINSATATLDLDKQVELIAGKLDLEDFQDPLKVEEFLERFTSIWDINNSTNTTASSAGLLFGGSAQFGIAEDVMLQIQQFRRT
ncbi:MAG: DUF1217 domain-containing protein [Pseudomonadota bacterium]